MEKSVTGTDEAVSKDEIIKTAQERFEKVRTQKAERLENWKNGLTELTKDAKNKKDEYNEEIEKLEKEISKKRNIEENEKKIEDLKAKIKKLDKEKYSSKDLKDKQKEILKDLMINLEGKLCPFCGKDFGSEQGVKIHLSEKNDGLTDKELKKMNTAATRSTNYANKYKKKYGTTKFDVEVPLEEFDNKQIKVDVSEEIHHLISVEPYSSTLRISRIGNLIGFNINDIPNLISTPTVDAKSFKKAHEVAYSELSDGDKYKIGKKIIETSETQLHQGGHGFSPAKGLPSYEKKLVQDLAELEAEVMIMSKNGCLGQTSKGRKEIGDHVKRRIEDLQKEVRKNIVKFKPEKDSEKEVERFLAQADYDYYIGKGS